MSLVIETKDLWRVYSSRTNTNGIPALRGVDLNVEAGSFVALKGRSGSGKTTLLNCLAGLDKPTSGEAIVLGHDLMQMSDDELTRWRREQIGLVFQSFGLLPTLSAYENIELLLRIKGDEYEPRHQRALECLEIVGLSRWRDHRPYEMSGGQQQRVAIARALANHAQLILADEPTGELDSKTTRELLTFFRELVESQHITMLMVSHDPLVDQYVHQVLTLKDGVIENHN
ncbi:MAG: ABC transporter ATP-binding protein [Anaerolineae bacterium]|nr:ABC transporter ATP-binding protein [Anaerolineae bacterium]MCI0608375.1 ABC transporter ATP-binding protein [Anaerolineae bacterium]